MFHSTRIRLTGWYLLIIMAISIAFSVVVYGILTRELNQFSRLQQIRIEQRFQDSNEGEVQLPVPPPFPLFDPELLEDSQQHIVSLLVFLNLGILVISGALGYFLAGRTLQPIETMVEEHNRFVSDASHELRTPLTALKSAIEVNLRDKKLDIAQVRTLLKQSILEVDKLEILSDNLLRLSQYESAPIQLRYTKVSIVKVADDAIQKISPLAKMKKVTIRSAVKDITIEAQPESLQELLVILLDNAVKYSKEKGVVELSARKTDGMMKITCADHGIGISAKDLPHIFDRFYRADTARTNTKTSGYGLGLSIAKQVVKLHHGTISAESVDKKGTIFTVSLPIQHFS